MTRRDTALVLLGAWLFGIVAMAAVALVNFRTVDQLLADLPHPVFAAGTEVLEADGVPTGREYLRFLVSELNRTFFWQFGIVEATVGAVLTWLVWPLGGRIRVAVLLMWSLTLVLSFGVTPPIVSVGRELDFVPRDPPPPGLATFGLLHAAYTLLDGVKLVLGLGVAWMISTTVSKEPAIGSELD